MEMRCSWSRGCWQHMVGMEGFRGRDGWKKSSIQACPGGEAAAVIRKHRGATGICHRCCSPLCLPSCGRSGTCEQRMKEGMDAGQRGTGTKGVGWRGELDWG